MANEDFVEVTEAEYEEAEVRAGHDEQQQRNQNRQTGYDLYVDEATL
jgi:hypothetical protein